MNIATVHGGTKTELIFRYSVVGIRYFFGIPSAFIHKFNAWYWYCRSVHLPICRL